LDQLTKSSRVCGLPMSRSPQSATSLPGFAVMPWVTWKSFVVCQSPWLRS
jgi:hypothetical protein